MDIPADDEQPGLEAADPPDEPTAQAPPSIGEDDASVDEGWEQAKSMSGEAPTG